MNKRVKRILLKTAGMSISIGLPLAVSISYREVFLEKLEMFASAGVMMSLISGVFIFKNTTFKFFKTPSEIKLWLVIFILAFVTNKIAEQFMIISAFGLAGTGIGAIFIKASDRFNDNIKMKDNLDGGGEEWNHKIKNR